MKKIILLFLLFPLLSIGQWAQVGSDIDGESAGDNSGTSISVNDTGNRVAIGAFYNDGVNGLNSGHVRVYEFNDTSWIQLGTDIDGEMAMDCFGCSLQMNDDGNRIVIGAYRNDENGDQSGHVRVFEFNGSDWVQLGADIDGGSVNDFFGGAVSINDDGNIIAVGARYSDYYSLNSGHTSIYEFNGTNWVQLGEDIG